MKLKIKFSGFLFSAFILSLLSFSSCKKCGHCEYTYNGYSDQDATYCSSGLTTKKAYDGLKSSCQSGGGSWVEE